MGCRAGDRIQFSRPRYRRKKLGDDKTVIGFLNVLAKGPPTEIIDFLEFFVGTLEKRDVRFKPGPRRPVVDETRGRFFIAEIERVDVVPEEVWV